MSASTTRPLRHSVRDVARLAGVSVATVSNVMNRPDVVTAATQQRVQAAMDQLGFVRNLAAAQLRGSQSPSVGVVVLDVGNPFFTDVARGIEDRVAEDGGMVSICSTDEIGEKEARHLRMLQEQGARGILVIPSGAKLRHLEAIARRGTPVVLLDRASRSVDLCAAAVDDVRGGELAAAHLLGHGHRRIAFLNGPSSIRQCVDRRRGAARAVRAAGLDPDDVLVDIEASSPKADGADPAIELLLEWPRPPTAIMCVNDLLAIGALRALLHRGLRVPADVAIVGYDDIEFVSLISVPLTTVRQPKYQLGYTAADLLLSETQPDHRHRQVLLQPELVVRASTGIARPHPANDDLVSM